MSNDDLIRRGDLLKPDEKSDKILILGGRSGAGKTLAMAEALMKRKIETVPAVDAVPVVRGRWEVNTDDFTPAYRCSSCGYNKPMIAGERVAQGAMNYCPNCGADMRERKEK